MNQNQQPPKNQSPFGLLVSALLQLSDNSGTNSLTAMLMALLAFFFSFALTLSFWVIQSNNSPNSSSTPIEQTE